MIFRCRAKGTVFLTVPSGCRRLVGSGRSVCTQTLRQLSVPNAPARRSRELWLLGRSKGGLKGSRKSSEGLQLR